MNKLGKVGSVLLSTTSMIALVSGLTANAATKVTTAKPVEITFWYGIGNKLSENVQQMVKEFNASHPNIHVTATYQGSYSGGGPEQQKLLAALKAGNPPDLAQIEVNSMGVFANSGKLLDLTSFMKKSSIDNPRAFLNGMLVSTEWNGHYYGVPLNRSVPVFFYNKTLFKRAGIANPPTTWDQLAQDAKKLTSGTGSAKVYGYGPLVDWWPWESEVWSSGSELLSADGSKATFNTAAADRIIAVQQSLVKSGNALVETGPQYWDLMTQDFIKGKIAMDIDSIGDSAEVAAGVGKSFQWGTSFLPSDKTLAVPPGGGDMAVMAGIPQDHVTAAEAFIEWWTAPKQTLEWSKLTGYLPVQKAAVNQASYRSYLKQHPEFATAINELKYQKAAPPSSNLLGVLQYVQQALQGIYDEGKPVNTTMDGAVKQANGLLQ